MWSLLSDDALSAHYSINLHYSSLPVETASSGSHGRSAILVTPELHMGITYLIPATEIFHIMILHISRISITFTHPHPYISLLDLNCFKLVVIVVYSHRLYPRYLMYRLSAASTETKRVVKISLYNYLIL